MPYYIYHLLMMLEWVGPAILAWHFFARAWTDSEDTDDCHRNLLAACMFAGALFIKLFVVIKLFVLSCL